MERNFIDCSQPGRRPDAWAAEGWKSGRHRYFERTDQRMAGYSVGKAVSACRRWQRDSLCSRRQKEWWFDIFHMCDQLSYRREENKRSLFPKSRANASISHEEKWTDKMEDALEHTRDIFGKLPSCSLKIPGYPHQAFYVLSLFHQQTGREENRKSRKPEVWLSRV